MVGFEAILPPSVGVEEHLWKTVSAEKIAPLLPPSACAGVSLGVIGFHVLVLRVVPWEALLREEANNSFRVRDGPCHAVLIILGARSVLVVFEAYIQR
jgi:hypothetical protein